ncbi:hypothetical protein M440DRAFT_1184910 [Trichoderma longibrachiatum ATCC 18648]|uniref:Uncharacterized protein n=1 Tax=Trichoderma longibrachiatum ATCC 18648 TaxID=983965 RepID=A0A2T4C9B6_TRILO|nr:hypothetical protein M440DRAFT_1184910 [Trichoderma longibrachiatum ATCC 18648]
MFFLVNKPWDLPWCLAPGVFRRLSLRPNVPTDLGPFRVVCPCVLAMSGQSSFAWVMFFYCEVLVRSRQTVSRKQLLLRRVAHVRAVCSGFRRSQWCATASFDKPPRCPPICVARWSASPPLARPLSPVPTFYGRCPSRQLIAAADRVSRGGGRSRICNLEWTCGHTKSIPSTAARGTLAWLSPKAAILASHGQRSRAPLPCPGSSML